MTCRANLRHGRRLYFPPQGRHAVDFFARKIRRLRLGSNPRSWVPEASMLTTRPPKPLKENYTVNYQLKSCGRPRSSATLPTFTLRIIRTNIYSEYSFKSQNLNPHTSYIRRGNSTQRRSAVELPEDLGHDVSSDLGLVRQFK